MRLLEGRQRLLITEAIAHQDVSASRVTQGDAIIVARSVSNGNVAASTPACRTIFRPAGIVGQDGGANSRSGRRSRSFLEGRMRAAGYNASINGHRQDAEESSSRHFRKGAVGLGSLAAPSACCITDFRVGMEDRM